MSGSSQPSLCFSHQVQDAQRSCCRLPAATWFCPALGWLQTEHKEVNTPRLLPFPSLQAGDSPPSSKLQIGAGALSIQSTIKSQNQLG